MRIVPRKRIEDSVRLVGMFRRKYPEVKSWIKFIISLYQGDELDDSYIEGIKDLSIYLPKWEGFGNAYLEAVSSRVPVVISTYLVYKTDIKCAGFENIEIRDE